MSKPDYYHTLGVKKDSTEAEIKKAFRRLAMKHHPDRNQGDKKSESKFKEIKEAYEVLSDAEKRSSYDRLGHQAFENGMGASGAQGDFGDMFGDMFEGIFGGRGRGRGPQRGSDLQYQIEISLEEAAFGTQKTIRYSTNQKCSPCGGQGTNKGSSPVTCSTCNGQGQVRMSQGFFSVQQTCPKCHGTGKLIKDPCSTCRGQGLVQVQKVVEVKIPAGIDHGQRVRLSGEGEVGPAGNGDLYVVVVLRRHTIFHRNGQNLECEMPINFVTAALGGEVEIPTLGGHAKLRIPAESQSGKTLRLRGKGIKSLRGSNYGDLMCHIVVETPVNLNQRQKEILREFESASDDTNKHNPLAKSWMDKVKKFWVMTT